MFESSRPPGNSYFCQNPSRPLPLDSLVDCYFIEDGGLISSGANLIGFYRRVGLYDDRIFKGEKPDLPVQQPTKYKLVINLKTAKALGVDLPPTLLVLAGEVTE